jgi:single-stranded DNA-binding protein
MNYQKIILAGNATADAERRTAKSGEVKYTTFSVAVGDAEDKTTYFNVVTFGKYGESIADHVTKGRQVLVEGRIDVSDKGRFNVVADRVRFGTPVGAPTKRPKKAKKKTK